MNPINFFTFIIFTVICIAGVLAPAPYSITPIIFVFIGIPLLDLWIGVDKSNPNPEQEKSWKQTKVWAPALYLYTLTHFSILLLAANQVINTTSWIQLILLGVIVGLYTGGLGITVAHELCHKKETLPRFVADLLLASVWYQHFAVEHVRGHHLAVSTPEDPASARKNENVYKFLCRTITGSFVHALKVDQKEVLRGVFMALLFTSVAAFLGKNVLIFFLIQSGVAIILLELVNYVEHYGLSRKQIANGRYEKVLPVHSWNSAHKFSNSILFNLQRHSDHHAMANLPYTILKHQEEAPQLPSGYPGMIMLALVPPLWFKLMNQKVNAWSKN
jgi:alkane 1-monooxygenase